MKNILSNGLNNLKRNKMKLISMTDFVLEEGNPSNTDCQFADKVMSYANFLKQPLELWMFVPCDEEGNVLEEPNEEFEITYWDYSTKLSKYQQAKERVLFEGFCIDESYKKEKKQLPYLTNGKASVFLHSDFAIRHQIVEDLAGSEIQLTPTAIKQIGL